MRVFRAGGTLKTQSALRVGHFASIYCADASTAQGSLDTTPVKVTAFTTNGEASGATPEASSDQITVQRDGVYILGFSLSFSGTASSTFKFHIRVNAVEVAYIATTRYLSAADVGVVAVYGFEELSDGDVVTLYVEANAAGKSITIEEGTLFVMEVLDPGSVRGDVTGPGSSTDNALTRFDGTGGKTIQNSVGILDDTGDLSGISLTNSNVTVNGGTI